MVNKTLFYSTLLTTCMPLFSFALPTISSSSFTSSGILPMSSPGFLPSFLPIHGGLVQVQNPVPIGPITRGSNTNFKRDDYPEPWSEPDLNHPEVKKAIQVIDWNHVPIFAPRAMDMTYDDHTDEACWWSKSQCTEPKVNYLPKDVKLCPKVGDFGLTYDDGPLPPVDDNDPWAEPCIYDFLAKHNQQATLFYVGSNVAIFPEAAVCAIQSGHTLCAHTWSHPQMTTQTNEQVVAQLYWAIRAIKDAVGLTTRCWRPPYGDVDDRVRAIAHQMGLSTILWDIDSFDWGLPSIANDFAGTYKQADIDAFFQKWISDRPNDQTGHVVLEHETSNMSIATSEKWLPKLKEVFNVQKVHDCAPELPSPYWET